MRPPGSCVTAPRPARSVPFSSRVATGRTRHAQSPHALRGAPSSPTVRHARAAPSRAQSLPSAARVVPARPTRPRHDPSRSAHRGPTRQRPRAEKPSPLSVCSPSSCLRALARPPWTPPSSPQTYGRSECGHRRRRVKTTAAHRRFTPSRAVRVREAIAHVATAPPRAQASEGRPPPYSTWDRHATLLPPRRARRRRRSPLGVRVKRAARAVHPPCTSM